MYKNLCYNEDVYKVCFRSQGGLTIRGLANTPKLCTFTSVPMLGFLDIGGNDATTRAALDFAQDIVAYANYLVQGLGVVNVVIGQLLRRDPRKSPAGYNDDRSAKNKHTLTAVNFGASSYSFLETQRILGRSVTPGAPWGPPAG